jgi:DDE superfamily endonuclease
VPRVRFFRLCDLLVDYHRRSKRVVGVTGLSVPVCLSMTLRWLAGGSYLDICLWHDVSVSTFYHVVDKMIFDLDSILKIEFPFNSSDYVASTSRGFSRSNRSPLTGCIGAVDGIAIKIQEPSRGSVPNPSTYFNRKGFFALCVQAMCDNRFIFTFVSAVSPGSTHDSVAFAMSSLSELLEKDVGGVPDGYWIAADDAYISGKRIVTPWPGRNLSRSKDAFNYWQSSARIFIEQAFGMLVARWGILWRPLRVNIDKSARIVVVCMKLHNYILESCEGLPLDSASNSLVPEPSGIDDLGHLDPADREIHLQDEHDTDERQHKRRRDKENCIVRSKNTERIEDLGIVRPY